MRQGDPRLVERSACESGDATTAALAAPAMVDEPGVLAATLGADEVGTQRCDPIVCAAPNQRRSTLGRSPAQVGQPLPAVVCGAKGVVEVLLSSGIISSWEWVSHDLFLSFVLWLVSCFLPYFPCLRCCDKYSTFGSRMLKTPYSIRVFEPTWP